MTTAVYAILGLMNIVAFATYAIDKKLAVYQQRRVPEKTLMTLTFLGGAVGTLLAMTICRHKTRKFYFWVCAFLSLIIQAGLVLYLIF